MAIPLTRTVLDPRAVLSHLVRHTQADLSRLMMALDAVTLERSRLRHA